MKYKPCEWCGEFHGVHCPIVKAIIYRKDKTIKKVEFLRPKDYNKIDVNPDIKEFMNFNKQENES